MTVIVGDALEVLQTLEAESVQCCVTSPPYFGLRDYGTGDWSGGLPDCDHSPREQSAGGSQSRNAGALRDKPSSDCRCGAVRVDRQLGLEKTPELYVEKMVAVFREVRRVLKSDGTLWLNIGDSYAANRGYQVPDNKHVDVGNARGMLAADFGLKAKDLIGIPWMLAFALRADGWYLRQDIIWAKPNPMPESVTDRCTKAHEYLFLLTKSSRYYYDAEAVSEEAAGWNGSTFDGERDLTVRPNTGRKPRVRGDRFGGNKYVEGVKHSDGSEYTQGETRNKRSVWTVTTVPYREAHFATMPPKLVEPCIKAGSKIGDVVLDPFSGAGTVGLVASRLGRDYVGIELNPAYAEMSRRRIHDDAPLFVGGAA